MTKIELNDLRGQSDWTRGGCLHTGTQPDTLASPGFSPRVKRGDLHFQLTFSTDLAVRLLAQP